MGRKTRKPKRQSRDSDLPSGNDIQRDSSAASATDSQTADAQNADTQKTASIRLRFTQTLAVIVTLALVVRIINVLMTSSIPTTTNLVGDAAGYYAWAEKIAAGNWYGDETFYQAPLYPYFLAVLMKLGMGIPGMRIAQAILGAIGVAMLGLAIRNRFDERTSLVGAAMLALYPPSIYYDGIIQKAALASVLLCALLAAASYLGRTWRLSNAVLVGVLLALLVLTRENALLWIPLIGVWILWEAKPQTWKHRLLSGFAYVAGLALILMPVAARNASLGGEWSPTTFQAGPNFYIGNNLAADGIYRPLIAGHETPVYERSDAIMIAESSTGKEMTSRQVSRFWMNRSWQEIRDKPGRWALLMLQKSVMVVNWFEVPDAESMSIYQRQSAPLKLASLWNFGVLFPLAVVGIGLSLARWRELWLEYALLLIMIAAIVLFFVLGRYRLPLVPLLLPFAAFAFVAIWHCIQDRSGWRNLRGPLLVGLGSAALCFLPIHDVAGLTASSEMNSGIAAAQQGNTELAIRLLRQAVRSEPTFAETHYNLGRALLQAQKPEQAIVSFRNAIELDPTLPMADLMLGETLERLGNLDAARFHYQRATQFPSNRSAATQAITRLDARSQQ